MSATAATVMDDDPFPSVMNSVLHEKWRVIRPCYLRPSEAANRTRVHVFREPHFAQKGAVGLEYSKYGRLVVGLFHADPRTVGSAIRRGEDRLDPLTSHTPVDPDPTIDVDLRVPDMKL